MSLHLFLTRLIWLYLFPLGLLARWLGDTPDGHRLQKLVATLKRASDTDAAHDALPNLTSLATLRSLLIDSAKARAQAETARHESEARFRAIFEQAAMGLSLVTLSGQFLLVNQKLCGITGYTQAELLTQSFQNITHPDDIQADLACAQQLVAGEIDTYSMEKRYLQKGGATVWIRLTVSLARSPDGSPDYFISAVEDVQSRKAVEAALQQSSVSRERLQAEITEHQHTQANLQRSQTTLIQAARIARFGAWSIELLDLDNFGANPVTWSDEMYQLMDYPPKEGNAPLSIYTFFEQLHPDDRQPVMDAARQAMADKRPWRTEFRVPCADASERLLVETGEFTFDAAGHPCSMHGAVIDITAQRQTENQLRDSEARLRIALEGAGAGSCEWNLETGVDIWSEDLWQLFGLPAKVEQPNYELFRQTVHPDDLAQVEHIVGTAIFQKKNFEVEWRVKLPPGAAQRWMMARSSPVVEKDGRVIRYRGIGIDITRLKQAEFALQNYRDHLEERVAERTADLLLAESEQRRLNRALRLLSNCNVALVRAHDETQLVQELCRLVVQSGGYLMGWVGMAVQDAEKSVRAVAQAGHEEGYLQSIRVSWDETQAIGRGPTGTAIRTGTTQVNQHWLTNPKMDPWREAALQRGYQSSVALPLLFEQQILGALTLYSANPQTFGAGEVALLEELASDMAFGMHALRTRHQLAQHQQDLEARVTERTQEITHLNNALQAKARDADAATHAKSVFLSTMSHEIRTPLNAVVGLTELLADSPLTRSQRDYTEKIQLSAQALRALIDDILDFSKIEAGALRLEQAPFSLAAILRTLAAVIGVGLGDKPVEALFEVAPDLPDAWVGDALRLQQILLNLVSNAVKFTHVGEIVISVRYLARQGQQRTLQFVVRDTGIGIAPEQLTSIFEGFKQADSATSRLYGGSGLGLTISTRLARLMGGHIQVTSTLGHGSEFCLDVALTLGLDETLAMPAPPDLVPPALSLLLIEDHPLARTVLTQTCTALGWQVTALDSGAAGLAELQRSATAGPDYDVMLLDWRMPAMDGLAMLHQAHTTPGIGLPLVILMVQIFELEQAVTASVSFELDAIVTKPMTPASLLEAVTRAYSGEFTGHLAPAGKLTQRLAGKRLLVAEDNELNQEVIGQMLERAGAEVVMAANGLMAVAALRSPLAHFDAVLMDIQMPLMDGYTATRVIREELGRVDLPIIAVTAFAGPEDRDKSRLAGMTGHLVKPLVIEDLLTLLTLKVPGFLSPLLTPQIQTQTQPRPEAHARPIPLELVGLDLRAALDDFDGDAQKYSDLLHKFLQRHGGHASEALRLFNAQDTDGAARLVHDLSGIASLLHAHNVAQLSVTLEAALRDGQAPPLPSLWTALEAALQIVAASADQLATFLAASPP